MAQGSVNTFNIYFKSEGENVPGTPTAPSDAGGIKAENPLDAKSPIKQAAAVTVAASIGKKAVSYVTTNIGEWTGNSELQRGIEMGTKALGYGIAFAVNPVLGAANLAFDIVTGIIDYSVKQAREKRERENSAMLSGLSLSSRN